MASDPRHNARIIVLQKLFERTFANQELKNPSAEQFSDNALQHINALTSYDSELAETLFAGVVANQEKIDKIIKELAPQWPIDQIGKTDLQILRIAILEGFILKVTPEKVAIDEAVELSKEFANEHSRKFINGVLGSLLNKKDTYQL
jgi:N utilization substance protein B